MESNDNLMDIKEEDLKFMPLKVDNPFTGNESEWFPLVNLDSPNINNFINNFIFGFSTPMVPAKIDDNFYKNIEYFNENQNYMDEIELNPGNNLQGYDQSNMGYNQQGFNQPNMQYDQLGYNQPNMQYDQLGYNQLNMGYNQQWDNQPNMEYNQEGMTQSNMAYNQPKQSDYTQFNTECNGQGNNTTQNCNNLGVNYQQYPKEGYGEELISYEKGYINNLNSNLDGNLSNNLNNNLAGNLNNNLNGGFLREDNIEELPHIRILREYNFFELAEEDLRSNNKEKVNNIFNRIEGEDNSILNTFKLYEIPYPMASIIVKKIINDVLDYE